MYIRIRFCSESGQLFCWKSWFHCVVGESYIPANGASWAPRKISNCSADAQMYRWLTDCSDWLSIPCWKVDKDSRIKMAKPGDLQVLGLRMFTHCFILEDFVMCSDLPTSLCSLSLNMLSANEHCLTLQPFVCLCLVDWVLKADCHLPFLGLEQPKAKKQWYLILLGTLCSRNCAEALPVPVNSVFIHLKGCSSQFQMHKQGTREWSAQLYSYTRGESVWNYAPCLCMLYCSSNQF